MKMRLAATTNLLLLSLLILGCSQQQTGSNITSVTVAYLDSAFCNNNDPCSIEFHLDVKDSASGWYWYRVEVYHAADYFLSKPMRCYSNGNNSFRVVGLAPYWELSGGYNYDVGVHHYNSYSDAIDHRPTYSGCSNNQQWIDSLSNKCNVTCCTDTMYSASRWYTIAYEHASNITGIRGDFHVPDRPRLCAYQFSIHSDRSGSFVNVTDENSGKWCQAGLIAGRAYGNNFTEYYVYLEVMGDDWDIDYFTAPSSGDVINLGVMLDQSTGYWYIYVHQMQGSYIYVPGWSGGNGTRCDASGEILRHETDMHGTAGNPMIISDLEWTVGSGSWQTLNASSLTTRCSDWDEWWIKTQGDQVIIYDKIPQP